MKQVETYQMSIESAVPMSEEKAVLILTYSGSIIGIGPVLKKGKREVIYASIGIRKDVPEKLIQENLVVKKDIKLDSEVEFSGGNLKKSSPAYKIALMSDRKNLLEQSRDIEEATKVMTKEFVSINNTVIPE